MAESPPPFEDLLQRLAAEHAREVGSLRAEIERLQGRLDGPRAPGSARDRKTGLRFQGEKPDEDALAAAFAVAEGARAEPQAPLPAACLEPSRTCSETKRRTTKVHGVSQSVTEMDPEVAALWSSMAQFAREQVRVGELPKVHRAWDGTTATDFGLKMKNLIGRQGVAPSNTNRPSLDSSARENRIGSAAHSFCHHAVQRLRVRLPSVPLHPSCRARLGWDLIGVLLLLHDLIMIPMSMYNSENTGLPHAYDRFLDRFDYFSAGFWTCDVVINFFTGFHATSGHVEMRMPQIARHYCQSWLTLDLCIVSVDWTMTVLNQGGASDFMRLSKTASRFMRIVRLLRFMKMNKHMSELMARINSEYVLTVIGLVKLVVLIVIINHYIACAWFGLSQVPDKESHQTWVNKYLTEKGMTSLTYSYFTSLHWSLTQFTPASMEVSPQNVYERSFNVVVIICALVVFSSFVSSITQAMTHIRTINARAVEQDSLIRHYFSENNIPHSLASKVWHVVRQKRVQGGKRLKMDELPILQQLPVRLRDELRQEVYTPVLGGHPLLRLYFRICPAALKRVCKKALVETSLSSGKDLKLDGEAKGNEHTISKMIFVVAGVLEYHLFEADEEEQDCPRVLQGQWACEAALWAERAVCEGHFVAAPGGSDLVLLDAEAFRTVAFEFVDNLDLLTRYSKAFMQHFTAAMLNEDLVRDDVLFNDVEQISRLVRDSDVSDPRSRLHPLTTMSWLGGDTSVNSLAWHSARGSNSSTPPLEAMAEHSETRKLPRVNNEAMLGVCEETEHSI